MNLNKARMAEKENGNEKLRRRELTQDSERQKRKMQKRYFKIFTADTREKVFQKINDFSRNNEVSILNYEILSDAGIGKYSILIFYSEF